MKENYFSNKSNKIHKNSENTDLFKINLLKIVKLKVAYEKEYQKSAQYLHTAFLCLKTIEDRLQQIKKKANDSGKEDDFIEIQFFEKCIFHIDRIIECYDENIKLDPNQVEYLEIKIRVIIPELKEDIQSMGVESMYYK